jgi:glycine/D-amino acid oxidase-like deaminating enzyme
MLIRLGTPYWLDQYDGPGPRFSRARGRLDADVAIVGGGITGSAAALLFARGGLRTVVLEAQRVGRGSTAASTALLMQEPDSDFDGLAERYGAGVAARIWRASQAAVRRLVTTLDHTQARVGLHRLPSIYFARDAGGAARLGREWRRRRDAGIGGRWISEGVLRRLTGLDGTGAILTTGNAQADPYRACLALARGAVRNGARIFEHSPVVRVRPHDGGVNVVLDGAEVRAAWVVVSTGYATPEFRPLAGRFRMQDTYVIATPRLPPPLQRRVGLGDLMLWDTARPYHYARWTPDRRLLFGGCDRPHTANRPRRAALARDLAAFYPPLEDAEPDYAWEGLFATTPDGLPYIGAHRRYPRHLFALGYGGNGMTFGYLAAEILLRTVRGRSRPDDALFGFGRIR